MYDDIAFNPENPRPGVIINKPNGNDVYQGVPKVNNFYYPVHYFNLARYHFINYYYIIYLTTLNLLFFFLLQDYTGNDVNTHNFYAVLLGNKSALTGGSGKVLNSGPNDHVFIYYADHGSPGMVGK